MYKYADNLKVGAEVMTGDNQVGVIVEVLPAWTRVVNRYRVEMSDGQIYSFDKCQLFEPQDEVAQPDQELARGGNDGLQ